MRTKTSIYVDESVWQRFREYSAKTGKTAADILEEMMKERMLNEVLEEALGKMGVMENYQIEFSPVESVGVGTVSGLVRSMRDGGEGSIPR
jgi:predicted DNA-binding protein